MFLKFETHRTKARTHPLKPQVLDTPPAILDPPSVASPFFLAKTSPIPMPLPSQGSSLPSIASSSNVSSSPRTHLPLQNPSPSPVIKWPSSSRLWQHKQQKTIRRCHSTNGPRNAKSLPAKSIVVVRLRLLPPPEVGEVDVAEHCRPSDVLAALDNLRPVSIIQSLASWSSISP
jgi:hypothetical protein